MPLCRWAGAPPESGRAYDQGDTAFEKSRERALSELRAMVDGERTEADAAALHERALSARYRVKLGPGVPLSELAARWAALPRRKPLSAAWRGLSAAWLGDFAEHVRTVAPRVRTLDAVPVDAVKSWLDGLDAAGVSAKTVNDKCILVRGVFSKFAPYCRAAAFFKSVPLRDAETVHRTPYSPDELRRILRAAQADTLLRGPVTCAICTGLRRADACGLRWRAVDLPGGFVAVKTGKTGALAEIPIFEPLRAELERARAAAPSLAPSAAVWPDAARMLAENDSGLDWRLKRILCAALRPGPVPVAPALLPGDLRRRAFDALAACGYRPAKAERAGRVLDAYLGGASMNSVARALGAPLSFCSAVFNDIQNRAGVPIIRQAVRRPAVARDVTVSGDMPDGMRRTRRPSIGGWHAFRTSWATLALSAGVPPEIVARVTAHGLTRTLTRHYFKPSRDAMRAALQGAGFAGLLGE